MSSQRVRVRLQRIVDGDTVYVIPEQGGDPIYVRLMGIDAPESEQDWGQQATNEIEKILTVSSTDTLWMEEYGPDSSGDRTVGLLYWNRYGRTRSANREMVRRGFAHIDEHPQGKHDLGPLDFYSAKAQARKNRLGIWSSPDEDRENPRAFRARQRPEGQQDDTRLDDFINLLTSVRTLLGLIFVIGLCLLVLLYLDVIWELLDDAIRKLID